MYKFMQQKGGELKSFVRPQQANHTIEMQYMVLT